MLVSSSLSSSPPAKYSSCRTLHTRLEVDGLPLHRQKVRIFNIKLIMSSFSYCFITLLSKNYISSQGPTSLLSMDKLHNRLSSQVSVFF